MDPNPLENNPPRSQNPDSNQEKLDVKIEIATPEDWQACKELRLLSVTGPDAKMFGLTPENLQEEKNKSEEEWRKESSSDNMFSVLARSGSNVVGLGRARKVDEIWRIRNGYVKPEFRNQGISHKMFAIRLHEIQKRGGTKVVTGIRIDNATSLHIAEKFGFKRTGTDNDWYLMELDFNDPGVIRKINEVLNEG